MRKFLARARHEADQPTDYIVPANLTVTTPFVLLGASTLTIEQGGALFVDANGQAAIDMNGATSLAIVNRGLVSAVNANVLDGRGAESALNLSIVNTAGAVMRSDLFVLSGSASLKQGGTVLLDNAGLIDGTFGSVDWSELEAGQVTIINRAGGILLGSGDVLQPGSDRYARVQIANDGRILSTGGGDGIDLQSYYGGFGADIVNGATGTIEGGRHGITGNNSITVTNEEGGAIVGRNGSGVNMDTDESDRAVIVINHGLISGNGSNPADGDGDGVDVDYTLLLVNDGRVEGTSADNVYNFADGVAAGGGQIENLADGSIFGETHGVLIDDSNLGAAFARTVIANAGEISSTLGPAIMLIGGWNDRIANDGAISSQAGIAIDFGGGNDRGANTGTIIGDVLLGDGDDRFTDAGRIFGIVDGGDGRDRLSATAVASRLEGGAGDDLLTGGAGHDTLSGGADNDMLHGGAQTDTLIGGGGDDRLDGGVGADTMVGGAGDDTYYVDSDADKVSEEAGGGNDRVFDSTTYLYLGNSAVEKVIVTEAGSGLVFGGAVDNVFIGSSHDEQFYGNDGDDALRGNGGADRLDGGEGDDVLTGGAGADYLAGGNGADGFMFEDGDFAGVTDSDADLIYGFTQGDKVNLSKVDAIAGTPEDDAFAFLGNTAFTGHAGELRVEHLEDGNTMLFGDTDGDGQADLAIAFQPLFGQTVDLHRSDLVL